MVHPNPRSNHSTPATQSSIIYYRNGIDKLVYQNGCRVHNKMKNFDRTYGILDYF